MLCVKTSPFLGPTAMTIVWPSAVSKTVPRMLAVAGRGVKTESQSTVQYTQVEINIEFELPLKIAVFYELLITRLLVRSIRRVMFFVDHEICGLA